MTAKNNFRFKGWQIYADAKIFARLNIAVVTKLPKEYRYELDSQIIRSSTSVVLNIAEGSGKYSDKDFKHYLNIVTGSLFETIAALDLLIDLDLVTTMEFDKIWQLGNDMVGQLTGFKKHLSSC